MFKTRFLSSVVLVILMVLGIFVGKLPFAILFMAISLIGMMELFRIYKMHKSVIAFVSYGALIIYDVLVYFGYSYLSYIVLIGTLMVIMTTYVITFPKYDTNQMMTAYIGFVYVGVMLSFVFRIRNLTEGLMLVWLVFICTWINDTCAYLVGVKFGKHKMTPKLSPKKSYEGAIGGILGSAIVAALYGVIFSSKLQTLINPPLTCAVACAFGALISIFGDLVASAIKRDHDIKDYGKIIPGHGGILDRFDSMIFIAPVVYLIIMIL